MLTKAPSGDADCSRPPSFPWGRDLRRDFLLDPSIRFLNHGSFGAVPLEVLAAQDRWRRAIEARPIELLGRRVRDLLRPPKTALARVLGCAATEIGFVTNATEAINGILGSLSFSPGDELLTTTHVYNAVRRAMQFVAQRSGATVRELALELPLSDRASTAQRIIDEISPSTKLLVIDHVTSPTALVLPVEEIVAACRARGVMVLVDGAHAPGMLALNLAALDADAYVANLHKWLLAPKGCGMLRVADRMRAIVHPCVVSHFLGEGFEEEFDWQGTRDITAWLALEESIAYLERLDLQAVMSYNHQMVCWAHAMLCERLGSAALSPLDGSMLGSMATIRLPPALAKRFEKFESLGAYLYEVERIEVPIMDFGGHWHVRVSCQIHNHPDEYVHLAEALLRAMTASPIRPASGAAQTPATVAPSAPAPPAA